MKKDGKKQRSENSGVFAKRFIALILTFFISVILLAETYALLTQLIPYVSITMFQMTGISVEAGLTIAEFSVGDLIVLCMMWGLPSLCGVALVSAAQWKLICFAVGKMARMLRNAFRRTPKAPAENTGKE